jgi:hypothetical protein
LANPNRAGSRFHFNWAFGVVLDKTGHNFPFCGFSIAYFLCF